MNSLIDTRLPRRIGFLAERIGAEIAADRSIYAAAAAYVLAAGLWLGGLSAVFGAGSVGYGEIAGSMVGSLFLPTGAAGVAIAALIANPRAPLHQIGKWLVSLDVPRLVAGLALLVPTTIALASFSAVKATITADGFAYDRTLSDIGRFLFFDRNPIDVLHAIADPGVFGRVIDYIYGTTWFYWTYGILVYVAMSGSATARRRYFLGVILMWAVLGNVVAGLVTSAGPCFYGAVTGDVERFGPSMAALQAAIGSEVGAMAFQSLLWRMHETGQTGVGAGISAFPSMHVAVAAFNAMVLSERGRVFAVIAWSYLGVILFGSVYLGWHYALDGLFSIVAVVAIHRLMRRLVPEASPALK